MIAPKDEKRDWKATSNPTSIFILYYTFTILHPVMLGLARGAIHVSSF
jgi:hypothetical protein